MIGFQKVNSFPGKLYVLAAFTVFVIFFGNIAKAQQHPVVVERSNEKVLLHGKVFYVHIVKKGETIYSIAKAYLVSTNDIITANPNAANGIVTDQTLWIPESSVKGLEVQLKDSDSFIWHVVLPGQTLFSISRMYNVTILQIEKLNPELKYDSLQVNQVIKIPVSEKHSGTVKIEPTEKTDTLKFIMYKVEPHETLYSLAKRYNVTQESIIHANPELSSGLKAGETIKIPIIIKVPKPIQENPQNEIKSPEVNIKNQEVSVKNPETIAKNQEVVVNCDTIKEITGLKNIKVAILLPFSPIKQESDEQNGLDYENNNEEKITTKQEIEFDPISSCFIEFYEGTLLAVEKAKKKGISIDLSVYDIEKSKFRMDEILNQPQFAMNNLIIGPVVSEKIKPVAEYAAKHGITMVSPVSNQDEILNNNPFVFQVNPGENFEDEAFLKLIKKHQGHKIVFVYPLTPGETDKYAVLRGFLQKQLSETSVTMNEAGIVNNDFSNLETALDSMENNLVISPVEDEIFSDNLLRNLKSLLDRYSVNIIGSAEWVHYKSIDLEYLYDLGFSYIIPFYINYNDENQKEFLRKYRYEYNSDPVMISHYGYSYAMLGYDVMNYFLSGIATYGKAFPASVNCFKEAVLSGQFRFVRQNETGGYENNSFFEIQYNKDLTVSITKIVEK